MKQMVLHAAGLQGMIPQVSDRKSKLSCAMSCQRFYVSW